MAVAEVIAGKHGHVNYGVIPGVIYTHPEVASVGQTEEQLKDAGRAYKAASSPSWATGAPRRISPPTDSSRSSPTRKPTGILGAHIIGPMAGDLIHEICVAMEFGASAQDLALPATPTRPIPKRCARPRCLRRRADPFLSAPPPTGPATIPSRPAWRGASPDLPPHLIRHLRRAPGNSKGRVQVGMRQPGARPRRPSARQQAQAVGHVGPDRQPQARLVPRLQRGDDQAVMLRQFGAVQPAVSARIVGPSCSQTVSASGQHRGALAHAGRACGETRG